VPHPNPAPKIKNIQKNFYETTQPRIQILGGQKKRQTEKKIGPVGDCSNSRHTKGANKVKGGKKQQGEKLGVNK